MTERGAGQGIYTGLYIYIYISLPCPAMQGREEHRALWDRIGQGRVTQNRTGMAGQGRDWHGKARQGRERQGTVRERQGTGRERQGTARQCGAGQGRAEQGTARQYRARHGRAVQCRVWSWVRYDRAEQEAGRKAEQCKQGGGQGRKRDTGTEQRGRAKVGKGKGC